MPINLSQVPTDFGGAVSGTEFFQTSPNVPTISIPSVIDTAGDILGLVSTGADLFDRFSGRGRVSAPPPTRTAASSTVPVPPAGFGISSSFLPGRSLPQAQPAMASIPPAAVGAVRTGVAFVLRKIKANTGAKVTSKKIAAAIRQWGPATVAAWAGVSLAELMVVWDRGSRRVRRRFTKRDRSRGRAYIRMLKRQAQELKDLGCGPRTRTRRKVC